MELSSFSEHVVTVPFDRHGVTVQLEINIDAFTPEFFRLVGQRFNERMRQWKTGDATTKRQSKAKKGGDEVDAALEASKFFETEAMALEVKRQIHAELLAGGVLKGWDITENGIPVAPSVDVLLTLPPLLVESIWTLSLETAKTVKKTADVETIPSRTTHETTETGSQEFTIPMSAPIM